VPTVVPMPVVMFSVKVPVPVPVNGCPAGGFALVLDDRANLTAEQARSSSLTQLRSFNHRVEVASAAVQTEMKLTLKALDTPPTVKQEP